MTDILTNIETMKFIYKYLENKSLLFEFLNRATNNVLVQHIKNDINTNNQFSGYEHIIIKSELRISNSFKAQPDIYILIEFFIKQGEEQK